jgi:hypothetical protein
MSEKPESIWPVVVFFVALMVCGTAIAVASILK